MKRSLYSLASLCLMLLFVSSCKKHDPKPGGGTEPGPDIKFYAVTDDNRLLYLNAKNPTYAEKTVPITGLESSEQLAAIDFRPNTGQLFGLGKSGQFYVINTGTGAVIKLGAPFTDHGSSASVAGFDFNPTVDRIRVVTAEGGNFRVNPENGLLAATDGDINGASGASVTAVAYSNSVAGATSTTLFDIDIVNDKLYKQDPPNAGTLVEIGSLSVNATATAGFDISPDGNAALTVLTVNGKQALYSINLQTGKASKRGDLNYPVRCLAIPALPVAYALASGSLQILNPNTGVFSFTKAITGLQPDEKLLGLDMRPATGQLYALGSSSRIYQINISNGASTALGSGPISTLLNGTAFGFDFNPTVDRIRVVSNTGQNLRLHPDLGTLVLEDGAINPSESVITASAYSNNYVGATTTILYNIDSKSNHLVKQDPPNAGTIVDIGALGIDVEEANGFDISGTGASAYAVFTVSGSTRIYSVDVNSGKATAGPALTGPVTGFTLGLGL